MQLLVYQAVTTWILCWNCLVFCLFVCFNTKIKLKGRKWRAQGAKKRFLFMPFYLNDSLSTEEYGLIFSTWIDCACMPKEKHQEMQEFRLCNHFVCCDKRVYKNFISLRTQPQHPEYAAGATGVNGGVTWKLLLFMVSLWKPPFSSHGGGIRSLFYLWRHPGGSVEETWG